ncbi:MAG: DUF4249 family protein [Bacteroidota bacterium]
MRVLILITGLLGLLPGCVKQTEWPVKSTTPGKIVVDAILTDEVKSQQVCLAYPVSQLNQPPRPVTGASVVVSDEDSTWNLAETPAWSGVYKTPPYFFARLNKNYSLLIAYQNNVYSAKATMLPGSYFSELRFAKNETTGLWHVDWVANAFSTADAAMWELLIDWSGVAGYGALDSLATHKRMLFYTLPTLDVSEVFAPRMESIYFPAGTIVTERRYSVTPEHAEFIRELLLETNWTGGLFNVSAANVKSNLSNGALGFFGVCSVTELSVIAGNSGKRKK